MAAVNVAITKTPVSTTVILSVIADTSMVPVIVIASFTSFLLTTQVSLISTQRSRPVSAGEFQPVISDRPAIIFGVAEQA